jgi:hypothetical protein
MDAWPGAAPRGIAVSSVQPARPRSPIAAVKRLAKATKRCNARSITGSDSEAAAAAPAGDAILPAAPCEPQMSPGKRALASAMRSRDAIQNPGPDAGNDAPIRRDHEPVAIVRDTFGEKKLAAPRNSPRCLAISANT